MGKVALWVLNEIFTVGFDDIDDCIAYIVGCLDETEASYNYIYASPQAKVCSSLLICIHVYHRQERWYISKPGFLAIDTAKSHR